MKFVARFIHALTNGNAMFCLALIALSAIALAGITVNALVTITLAILSER